MMLRRKLVLTFGLLVTLMLATAVGAIGLLQGVLRDLHHLDSEAWTDIARTNNLATTISMIEIQLYELELGKQRHLDRLIELLESMRKETAWVQESSVSHLPENSPLVQLIRAGMPVFTEHVSALATAQDPEWAAQHRRDASSVAVNLRRDILNLTQNLGGHGEAEQRALTVRFRWMVLGLTIVFLILINVSIVALLRMAGMVLRPVEKLVEATRELAKERFDYRVDLDQKDEFDELARAYNNLAAELQANEQRKLEMLGQVALTLNHELNNAAAIIEMQLQLAGRQAGGNAGLEKYARQIRESLNRMTRTVELLKQVRRIVLTDYVSGVKMLDLERSASMEEGQAETQRE
ncbi:MAG: HAMP domain-containing protein [Bacillota bacterium]